MNTTEQIDTSAVTALFAQIERKAREALPPMGTIVVHAQRLGRSCAGNGFDKIIFTISSFNPDVYDSCKQADGLTPEAAIASLVAAVNADNLS